MSQNPTGIPLGVATAILEVEVSQLTKAERALTATIQNIAKAQELLLKGDAALQASAKTTLGILQQQQRTSGKQQVKEAQDVAAAKEAAIRAERERYNVATKSAGAEAKVTEELREQTTELKAQFSLQQRLADAARRRAEAASPSAGAARRTAAQTETLRNDIFGGGGRGGFGQGNPNIPTFAQFGLFPFAGLAGSLGATGVQQGILGASSLLGIGELGSFRNAITRLGGQLQGLGGIFGGLANAGASAATALGASSGGLAASLAAIGAAVAPLVALIGTIALLTKVIGDWQDSIQKVTETIQEQNQQIAEGATSTDLQGQRNTAQRRRTLDQESQNAFRQLLADFQASRPQGFTSQEELARINAPLNQRLSQLTGGEFTDLSDPSTQIAVQNIIGNFQTSIDDLGVTIAQSNAALQSSAVAQNDAAAAADRLAQAQIEAAESARGLSNQQLGAQINQWRTELSRVASQLISNVNISPEYRQELVEQAQQLQAQIQVYENLRSPIRDVVLALGQIPETLKQVGQFLEQVGLLNRDFARTQERQRQDEAIAEERREEDRTRQRQRAFEDFGRETQQAEEQYQATRQRVIDDAARADLELVAEAADRRQELINDAAEKELEAEEDHQRRLQKILRDGRTRILEAAARLDARGVLETQRRIADQVAEENQQREDARAEAQEKLAEQLADLDENLAQQRQKRQDDLNRRLQEMATEFAVTQQRRREDFARRLQQEDQERALQDQREAQDRALRRQRQAEDFYRQLNDQLQHYSNLAQIQQNGLSFLRQGFEGFFTQLEQRAITFQQQNQQAFAQGYQDPIFRAGAYASGIVSGSGTLFSGQGQFPTQFASGITRVPEDMLAGLHAGERVLTPLQNAAYERSIGSPTIVVNINGSVGDNGSANVRAAARDGAFEGMNEYMRQLATGMIDTASNQGGGSR